MENMNEISKYIGNSNLIQGEVYNSISSMKQNLSNKYISPIKTAIQEQNTKLKKNPSPEIRLIEAIKPFVSHAEHPKLNHMVDCIYKIQTLKNLSQTLSIAATPPTQPQNQNINIMQHNQQLNKNQNAIYEIDEKCVQNQSRPKISPLFLLLALME